MSLNFDDHVFDKLSKSLDDVFPEILDIFFTETESSLDHLETQLKEKNLNEVQVIVHKIKSSTKTFGANGLVELLEKIEGLPSSAYNEIVELQLSLNTEYKSVKHHIQNKN